MVRCWLRWPRSPQCASARIEGSPAGVAYRKRARIAETLWGQGAPVKRRHRLIVKRTTRFSPSDVASLDLVEEFEGELHDSRAQSGGRTLQEPEVLRCGLPAVV